MLIFFILYIPLPPFKGGLLEFSKVIILSVSPLFCIFAPQQAVPSWPFREPRKVRTTESTMLPNGKISARV